MSAIACDVRAGVYHDPAYLRAAATLEPGGRLHVVRSGDAMVPLIVRPLPSACGPGFDAISPYDFCGPVLNGTSPDEAWAAVRDFAKEQGVLTAFLRFDPLNGAAKGWTGLPGLTLVHSANNVVMHLGPPDEMLSRCKSSVSRDRKVAHREGVRFRLEGMSASILDEFVPLYQRTMDRVRARAFYRFPRSFFDLLERELGDRWAVATTRIGGERLVAASLILLDGTSAYYYLTGFDYDVRRARPGNMLVFETAVALYERGFERFHLGGGAPSLLDFKARFGPDRVPYYVGQAVFDPDRYSRLSHGRSGGFFPAYRAS